MFDRMTDDNETQHADSIEEAERYADHMRYFTRFYRKFADYLLTLDSCRKIRVNREGRILEVGAGTGFLTAQLARLFPDSEITALDKSAAMLAVARKLQDVMENGKIRWTIGDAENPKCVAELGRFDLICGSLVLHEFKDLQKAIDNFRGALNPSGALAFLDLRRVWWLYWIPSREGFFRSIRAAYLPREIKETLVHLGYTKCDVRNLFPIFLVAAAES